jgi:FAD/FMN-containing dehydrogenase
MSIPKEAYSVLESIVGSEYISEDPVDCEAHTPGPNGFETDLGIATIMKRPGCVIFPSTTEEVQKIVRTCNRYKIPFMPVSTQWWSGRGAPKVNDAILLDLKRMDCCEIDERHMYAVVGSGIIYSQLQEEAMKRGLYTTVPGGGSQVGVVANHILYGSSPLNYRTCIANRRILGVEWVLPSGEILRLGSLAFNKDDFLWGEGIGPDLRGLIRGFSPGWMGSMGIVTKMSVKLFPFQPDKPIPTGISPETALELPLSRMRWYNFIMPDKDAVVKAMYEIGKAEIAAGVTKVPLFWRAIAKANNKEEFWEIWDKESEESVAAMNVLRVLLIGFTSERQLEYEEGVLLDIMEELGGKQARTKPTDESWIKNADSAGMWMMCGGYTSLEFDFESIDHAIEKGVDCSALKKDFTPPLMRAYGDQGWFQVGDFGHVALFEFLTYHDPDDEEIHKVDKWAIALAKLNINKRYYTAQLASHKPLFLTGPAYGPDYHKWMLRIKEEFDPNNLSNPPVPADYDMFIDEAEWMKEIKDW